MPKSINERTTCVLDPAIFEVNAVSGLVTCKVCKKASGLCSMRPSHVSGHIRTKKHKRCVQAAQATAVLPVNIDAAPFIKQTGQSVSVDPVPIDSDDDHFPLSPHPMEEEVRALADLCSEVISDRMHFLGDYFEEIQDQTEDGKPFITCLLHPGDELSLGQENSNAVDTSDDEDEPLDAFVAEIITGPLFGTNHRGGTRTRMRDTVVSPDSPFYPWRSKTEFVTHLLFASPRTPFSDQQKRAILEWATVLGIPDVPSLYAVKSTQDRISELLQSPTEKITSHSGNTFYLNSINKAIALDFANPLTRMAMQDYPEDGQGRMSQVQHGSKMLTGLPDGLAPPSVRANGRIFFVDELLQQHDQGYFIPTKFFQAQVGSSREIELLSLGHRVSHTDKGFAVDPEQVIVLVSTFSRMYEDILGHSDASNFAFTESSATFAQRMPNPLRTKSGGRLVLTVPLIIFMDDVSGNVSKQWNKHHVIYMSNAALPREMLKKEFCVRFVASSPHAAPHELMQGFRDSLRKAAEDGIITWDAKYQEEVMTIPYALFHASDNPMQAEECSHAGLRSNYFCRTCKVGGTTADKKTDEGYMSIFKCGELRTVDETVATIKEQIDLAKLSGGTEKVRNSISKTGTHDSASAVIIERLLELGKRLRKRMAGKPNLPEEEVRAALSDELEEFLKESSIDECINPLLGIPGLDIHKDTPTEILHTILLGVVKYYWAQTAFLLDKAHSLVTFQIRLDSLAKEGLGDVTLGADYIVRYKGSLIGRHFKSLAQVMPYLVYDLVPDTVLNGWTIIGRLVVLLWHTEITDMEIYLADLSRAIEDLLTISAQCAPSILISKAKFHFLLHLPMFIRRFGPPILFSTERFESFNHVFRLSAIFSNRQAPSRDTCRTFSRQDDVKHIITGGFWRDPNVRRWVQAGKFVQTYMNDHPGQRKLIGIPDLSTKHPGATHLPTQDVNGKREIVSPVEWHTTQAAKLSQSSLNQIQATELFYCVNSVITVDGDKVSPPGFVIFEHPTASEPWIGKVIEILSRRDSPYNVSHIVISQLEILPELHPCLRVPRLREATPEQRVVITPDRLYCSVNVQHDCESLHCSTVHDVHQYQERLVTTRTKKIVEHSPINAYLLNTHALHNYRRIAAVLPPDLREQYREAVTMDHGSLRLHAAKLVRAPKLAEGEPAGADSTPSTSVQPAPAFDKTTKPGTRKASKTTKRKGKNKENPSGASSKATTVSMPNQIASGTQLGPAPTILTASGSVLMSTLAASPMTVPVHSFPNVPPSQYSTGHSTHTHYPTGQISSSSQLLPPPARAHFMSSSSLAHYPSQATTSASSLHLPVATHFMPSPSIQYFQTVPAPAPGYYTPVPTGSYPYMHTPAMSSSSGTTHQTLPAIQSCHVVGSTVPPVHSNPSMSPLPPSNVHLDRSTHYYMT